MSDDLFPDDRDKTDAVRVDAVRVEAAELAAAIASGGRAWESASGKATIRIKRWRTMADDMSEPNRTNLRAVADDLAGKLSMWFARRV